MDEARDVGAEMLVTACQHCRHNLRRWQDGASTLPRAGNGTTSITDLVDVVYEAAGLE
jgi:Fe-S oxidoreductase